MQARMTFLPPIPIPSFTALPGRIAVNADGTLFASVDHNQHCVHIRSAVDHTAPPVIVGFPGTHEQLKFPGSVCFVNRGGVDTLLVCDSNNHRVVEVTAGGEFLRAFALPDGSFPWGIAYCGKTNVVAVSLWFAHTVVLLQYESGEVKPEATIGSHVHPGDADGQLRFPSGVKFTADGDCILVADYGNDRVSKFNATSGDFIAHVATRIANGISYPVDVLQCEDGSIVVAQVLSVLHVSSEASGAETNYRAPSHFYTAGAAGTIIFSSDSAPPTSISATWNGIIVKESNGKMHLLCDAWHHSPRAAWLHAMCME